MKAFSDGYYATSTIALAQQFAGGSDSWQGTCIVYYTSELVRDVTDGSLCHVVLHDAIVTAGPQDFGSSLLMHVTAATWSPPQREGSLTPAGSTLTDAKYGLVHVPSAETKDVLTEGYYASTTWFQPVPSTAYASMRRYGRGDMVTAYCVQGAGSTSYFQ